MKKSLKHQLAEIGAEKVISSVSIQLSDEDIRHINPNTPTCVKCHRKLFGPAARRPNKWHDEKDRSKYIRAVNTGVCQACRNMERR